MKKTSYIAILFTIALLALGGCRSNPVLNITDAEIDTGSKSQSDVKTAIDRAARTLGWIPKEVSPGHIVVTLRIRTHVAVADIKYNKDRYSITYKDSTNLAYDGVNIHRNYNNWVMHLDQNIQVHLSAM